MMPSPSFSRRSALQLLAAGLCLSRSTAAGAELSHQKEIEAGFKLLDERFWSPELHIWLDRPGNDLRAFYEGRLNPPWWSGANAVETLADYMRLTGTKTWIKPLTELHRLHRDNPDHAPALIPLLKAKGQWSERDAKRRQEKPRARNSTKPGFRDFNNEYLDDSGWWGLAWLKMHALTGDPAFLETARAIQRHMNAHHLPDGGIIWNMENDPPVTNAITNGLFLTLSARLHSATGDAEYLDQARKTRQWFIDQKLYDGIGIVDGPGHKEDYWSYNQGMWILGLLALAEAGKEPNLIDEAAVFSRTLLEKGGFLKDGVLYEKLSQTGWDTALFKGVLARALGTLRDTLQRTGKHPGIATQLNTVLQTTAASLLKNSRNPDGLYGLQWQPGAEKQEWNFNSHLSALIALATVQIDW